jgi:hypothetical protein
MKTTPCIFNDNEIVIQQEIPEMKGYAIPLQQWNNAKTFFAINPVMEIGDNRKKENISAMKNFLFESDTLPIDKQKALLKKNKDIISMATYSGNKSIHFIIQIKDIPETIDEYRYVWKLLKDKYFQSADTQCNDCLRLSRTPEAVRENNKKQVLIWNTLQPIDLQWKPLYRKINEIRNMSMEYRKSIPIARTENLTYEAECVLNGDYPKGNRDEIIRIGLPYLFYNGYGLDEILENNMSMRNNPQTIKNFYHKLENGYYGN